MSRLNRQWIPDASLSSLLGSFLPSATKLRRLCFYKRMSVHRGEYLTRYPPRIRYPPPGPGTLPGTRYTPRDQVPPQDPLDQIHPPRTRYTPQDQVHPLDQVPPRPGTSQTRYTPGTRYTPQDQVHPPDQVNPPGPGTPPSTRYPPGPGTPPPPRYGFCCGRYASYWNAFLFGGSDAQICPS